MLTSKQRAFLRQLGNEMDPILQIGKGGIGDNVIVQAHDVLEARELIKMRVQKNVDDDPREVAHELAAEVGADVVQTIGRVALLYRRSTENPSIELPRG